MVWGRLDRETWRCTLRSDIIAFLERIGGLFRLPTGVGASIDHEQTIVDARTRLSDSSALGTCWTTLVTLTTQSYYYKSYKTNKIILTLILRRRYWEQPLLLLTDRTMDFATAIVLQTKYFLRGRRAKNSR